MHAVNVLGAGFGADQDHRIARRRALFRGIGVEHHLALEALGQIRMVRFANATGLQQVGNNLFSQGINSGEPIEGDPGQGGVGTLTSGAVELSNSDIGQNLIELILASTQYRGGARGSHAPAPCSCPVATR